MSRKKQRKRSRRGGRKPGKWEIVTPSEIMEYRKRNGLSRARMATLLGVSTTSIQNWETGRVAGRKIQERLRRLIDDAPAPAAGVGLPGSSSLLDDARTRTTGDIVSAYLQAKGKTLTPSQVTKLVRSVRKALS